MSRSSRTVQCARCGAEVVAHDAAGVEFRCPACAAVAIATDGKERLRPGRRGDLRRRREIDLSRFAIDRDGPDLFVSWRWSRLAGAAALVAAGVAGYFAFGFVATLRQSAVARGGWTELAIDHYVMPLGATAVTLFLAHLGVSALLNRTELAVHGGTLHAWHGPVPTPYRSRRVPLDDLDELRVYRKVKTSDGDEHVSFELHAVLKNGRWVRLIADEKRRDVPQAMKTLLSAHIADLANPRVSGDPGGRRGEPAEASEAPVTGAITLGCPKCGGTLAPPPERAEMRCRFCRAKVPVPAEVRRALGLRPARTHDRARFRATFTAKKEEDRLIFTAGWVRWAGWLALKLAAAPLLLGLLWIGSLIWFEGELLWFLPAGGLAAIGAAGGYVGLCYLWNRTTVAVDFEQVRVTHAPLPWRRSLPLPTSKIKQLVVRELRDYQGRADERYYELQALSHHGAALTLFGEIPDREALETLEYLIESRLGIVDEAVRG